MSGMHIRFAKAAGACLIALFFAPSEAFADPAPPAKPPPSSPAKAEESEPEPLPPAQAEAWVIAPHPREAWTLRIDNTGPKPIRIPADVRLLQLTIELPEFGPAPVEEDVQPKKKWAPKKPKPKPKKPIVCEVPKAMRPSGFPEDRALLLAPGESYIDTFDPYLLCFGKSAAGLTGAATVKPRLGFPVPKPKKTWGKKKKKPEAPVGPFAVEGTDYPAVYAPQYELFAPTMVLSYGLPPAEPKPAEGKEKHGTEGETERAPIVDANAPRLEIEGSDFVDATAERDISVKVKATNAGHRPMLAVLRPRMLSFRVDRPDGTGELCGHDAAPRGMPKDSFKTYKAGESTSFSVLLGEVCPRGTFSRPGVYRIWTVLHAEQTGAEHGLSAYTAVVGAPKPTLVRVKEGKDAFFVKPPKAVATPDRVAATHPEPEAKPE